MVNVAARARGNEKEQASGWWERGGGGGGGSAPNERAVRGSHQLLLLGNGEVLVLVHEGCGGVEDMPRIMVDAEGVWGPLGSVEAWPVHQPGPEGMRQVLHAHIPDAREP